MVTPKKHIPLNKMVEMLLENQQKMADEIVQLKAIVVSQQTMPSQDILNKMSNPIINGLGDNSI